VLERHKSVPEALAFLDSDKLPAPFVADIEFLYACALLKADRHDAYRALCRARLPQLPDEPAGDKVAYFAKMVGLGPDSGVGRAQPRSGGPERPALITYDVR